MVQLVYTANGVKKKRRQEMSELSERILRRISEPLQIPPAKERERGARAAIS
jgi:hypothetical protein